MCTGLSCAQSHPTEHSIAQFAILESSSRIPIQEDVAKARDPVANLCTGLAGRCSRGRRN